MMGELDDVLARLVDAHGLHKVCTALMAICYGKAEHPATNWQDRITARQWENAAKGHGRHIAACGYCKPCTALARPRR